MDNKKMVCKNKVKNPKKITFSWTDIFGSSREIPDGYKDIRTISEETGYHISTVARRLDELVKRGKALKIKVRGKLYFKYNA